MSFHEEALFEEYAFRLSVKGYLMKHQAAGNILSAIRRMLNGLIY